MNWFYRTVIAGATGFLAMILIAFTVSVVIDQPPPPWFLAGIVAGVILTIVMNAVDDYLEDRK